MKSINIIGTGRVGSAMGRLWVACKQLQVMGLFDRDMEQAYRLQAHLGQGQVVAHLDDLPLADYYLVSVPDDHISPVSVQLSQSLRLTGDVLKKDCVLFHCSGALPAQCLIKPNTQVHIASLHPILSIPKDFKWSQSLSSVYFSLEGEPIACERLLQCLKPLGVQVLPISTSHKMLYHIALVLSSNYLVTLMDISRQLLLSMGIESKQALDMLHMLSSISVTNATQMGPDQALTGPIARGDHQLVQQHEAYLQEHQQGLVPLYRLLADWTNNVKKGKSVV